ncbi:MAG TPA: helix-turn-helix transcriptional regulator [Thermoguttaceae bacterium]|nr:helix-turn-helix transcriptional regulator [Thermoguttaceae bacterium]
MAKKQQYASVSEVLRDIAPDDAFHAEFNEHIAGRKLVKHLMGLRAAQGLSQTDVANAIGCTQSRISKLENARDNDVRLGDLRAYANVLGCDFDPHPVPRCLKPVDKVKIHALAIKRHMDDLAQLARSDDKIAQGVAGFFYECFVNVFLMMGDSAKRLPLCPDGSPYFRFQIGGVEDEEQEAPTVQEDCGESEDAPEAAGL